jgi:hypothetical protein
MIGDRKRRVTASVTNGLATADRHTPYQQLRAAHLAIGYRVGLRKGPDRANSGLIWTIST